MSHRGVLIGRFDPGSAEWHAARANGIGGSEVAPILGISPFESRFSLWNRKKGLVAPTAVTPAMEWGNRLERAVLDKFLEDHPEYVEIESATFCHPDRPWHIVNPDLLLAHRDEPDKVVAIADAKTSRYGDHWGTPGTDEIPAYYRPQGIHYMDGLFVHTHCYFPVLVGGSDYREYVIEWDADRADRNAAAVAEFVDSLQLDEPPLIDDSYATWDALRELNPIIDGETIDIPDDLAVPFIESTAAKAAADAANLGAKSRLFDFMGDARKALWNGKAIATRQARGDGNPYLVAARSLPEITGTVPVAPSASLTDDGDAAPLAGSAADRAGSSAFVAAVVAAGEMDEFRPDPVLAAHLAERVTVIREFGGDALAELGRCWPVGVTTFKQLNGAVHTAAELEAIVKALDTVEGHHEIPLTPSPVTAETVSAPRRIVVEGEAISDGAYNDMQTVVRNLGVVERDVLKRWQIEARNAGVSFSLGDRNSHRRHRIVSAAITILRWDVTDGAAREVIGSAMGEEVQPAVLVGVALGSLTAEEADKVIDLVVALAGGADAQFDKAGLLVLPAA